MKFRLPVCCSDINGITSEKSLENHIARLLESLGYRVKRQYTITAGEYKITIDLKIERGEEIQYIEVKFNNFGATMSRAVGQVKWYKSLTKKPVYLSFACYDFAQLSPLELKFLTDEKIDICIVKRDKVTFLDYNEIMKTYGKICEESENFRGYREYTMKGGQLYY